MALTSLRGNFELKLKEGDRIVQEIETTNKAEIIFVTNKAQVYKIFAHDIEDHKPSFIGDYTPNLLELDEGESVVVMYATDREYRGQMLFVFEDRRAVRVDVSAYETKNRRRKIVSAYSDHAPLVGAAYIGVDENPEFGVINNQGKLLIFSSSQVTYKATRTARGSFIMSGSRLDKTITNFLHSTQLSQLEDPDYYKVKKLPGSGRYIRDKAFEDKQISLENL